MYIYIYIFCFSEPYKPFVSIVICRPNDPCFGGFEENPAYGHVFESVPQARDLAFLSIFIGGRLTKLAKNFNSFAAPLSAHSHEHAGSTLWSKMIDDM